MIAYRIQDKHRGTEYLLDPETQYSWPMDYDESKVRRGVSGRETIAELAAYWATHSVEATDPVLVRVEGPQSDDTPVWTLISYLTDLHGEDYTLTYNQLVEKAEEWLENNR